MLISPLENASIVIYDGPDRCQLLFDELYRLMMPELLLIKPFSYERELKNFLSLRLNNLLS